MTHFIRFMLGFLIGMSGSYAYKAFDKNHKLIGVTLMVLGYALASVTGVLIGMGRLD